MGESKKKIRITEVVLRDAHQSLFATRMRIEDMLPIASKLDQVGYWALESWGGATFDACIRFLGEDPWERIRRLKEAMPNTPQQMLLRGQNLLGYRHYADDLVKRFVDRAATNGVDVFRVFDAMNDVRNLKTAIEAVRQAGKHAQGTISFTQSPVHTIEKWLEMAREIEDLQAHSIAIKDMAGLLRPYQAYELVSRLKEQVSIPIHLHCHATTGLSLPTALKAIEAGVDNVDTAISSMSMTYGHSPTETMVSMLSGTEFDTGLDLGLLEEIAAYFRDVRKKYAQFEGSLKGVDSRILVAQVPGGMFTNMENQLREQGAADRLDEVLEEIPRVRKDLGYIPLVTPTSQIVGTQAVMNVLAGKRYERISKEAQGVLKGEYGAAPAPYDNDLRSRVLKDGSPISCRPADLLKPEFEVLSAELEKLAQESDITLCENKVDDVLTYALFPQVGFKFLRNRGDASAFEPIPNAEPAAVSVGGKEQAQALDQAQQAALDQAQALGDAAGLQSYSVRVNGRTYQVEVAEGDVIQDIRVVSQGHAPNDSQEETSAEASVSNQVVAPLAGNIIRVLVAEGQDVQAGQVVIVMEAMKMETEIRAVTAGRVVQLDAKAGASVVVGDPLLSIS